MKRGTISLGPFFPQSKSDFHIIFPSFASLLFYTFSQVTDTGSSGKIFALLWSFDPFSDLTTILEIFTYLENEDFLWHF